MEKLITKASGEQEPFNIEKFKRSLKRAGATGPIIKTLAQEIEKRSDLDTTHEIYQFALEALQRHNKPLAARYNLKNALIQFGPTGFPFEQFVAKIFQKMGYNVLTNQTMSGYCITHEIDLLLKKNTSYEFVECKFHNTQGLKSTVKIPLYVRARFDDIAKSENTLSKSIGHAWVVTNTKFTEQALEYAQCARVSLLDWAYPINTSLSSLIDRYGLHPITSLTSLSMKQKRSLLAEGLVLCQDIDQHAHLLQKLKVPSTKISEIQEEARGVCNLVKE